MGRIVCCSVLPVEANSPELSTPKSVPNSQLFLWSLGLLSQVNSQQSVALSQVSHRCSLGHCLLLPGLHRSDDDFMVRSNWLCTRPLTSVGQISWCHCVARLSS